ncbi:MAG: hypothetical protein JNK67_25155 [Alphaproteobacteria bacterium]|nr:hypothetical protein [Alphaproteobacteria bacterium]
MEPGDALHASRASPVAHRCGDDPRPSGHATARREACGACPLAHPWGFASSEAARPILPSAPP